MSFLDKLGDKKPSSFALAMQITRLVHGGGDVVGFIDYIRSIDAPANIVQQQLSATKADR
jgi:hypothetical protein